MSSYTLDWTIDHEHASAKSEELTLSVSISKSNDYDRSDSYYWGVRYERYEDGVSLLIRASGHEWSMHDAILAAEAAMPDVRAKIPVREREVWEW